MRNLTTTSRWKKSLLFILGLSVMLPPSLIQARLYNNAIETEVLSPIVGAKKINPTTVEILFPNSQRMTLDFYGENIFRVFQDNSGSVIVLEMMPQDYSLTDIARLVEANNAHVLNLLSHQDKDTGRLLITLKIDLEDASPVIRSFERFNYTVLYHFMEKGMVDDMLQQRMNELLHYMNM